MLKEQSSQRSRLRDAVVSRPSLKSEDRVRSPARAIDDRFTQLFTFGLVAKWVLGKTWGRWTVVTHNSVVLSLVDGFFPTTSSKDHINGDERRGHA